MASSVNNVSVGSASVEVDGIDIGFTNGGVKLNYQPTFVEVRADQAAGVIRRFKQEERLFVEFEMLEITLENLASVFGYPDASLSTYHTYDALYLGYSAPCSTQEVPMRILSPGINCASRIWEFPRTISVSEATLNFQRDQESRLSAKYEILKGTNLRFGVVYDLDGYVETFDGL